MLTCQDLTDLVTDYLEGQLSLKDRVRFQLHLGMCRRCRAFLHARKVTIEITGALPAEPVPAEVRDALLHRFRDWRSVPVPPE